MIFRVSVVLRGTVCGDTAWRFDNLSGSHHQSDDFRSDDDISDPLWWWTSAQVVETSVNVITNSPSQDYTHPDDYNLPTYELLGSNHSQSINSVGIVINILIIETPKKGIFLTFQATCLVAVSQWVARCTDEFWTASQHLTDSLEVWLKMLRLVYNSYTPH